MIKTMLVAASLGTMSIFTVVHDFQTALPQPVEACLEDYRLTEVKQALKILKVDERFAKDIFASATAKNINPLLWACNVWCESEFKITAKSSMGYKGLGQTPKAVMKTGYELGDLTYAACIFDEKMKVAKGDTFKAMQLYKGGLSAAAKRDATKVFTLYEKLKTQIKEQQNG